MKPALRVLFLIAVLYGATAVTFWVTAVKTVTIYPTMDSYSWESFPNANNGGSDNFEITSYDKPPNNMRGWLWFNISKLPPDALLISGTLRLRIWHKTTNDLKMGTADSTGRVYGVYMVTQPWREYNITWANQPNYTNRDDATSTVPPGQGGWEGPLLYMDWKVTAIVKLWLSGTPNYGVLVKDTQENATILYSTQFFTHDKTPNVNFYPRLILTYVMPTPLTLLALTMIVDGLVVIGVRRMWLKRSSTEEK
jgi:hypothetical protein